MIYGHALLREGEIIGTKLRARLLSIYDFFELGFRISIRIGQMPIIRSELVDAQAILEYELQTVFRLPVAIVFERNVDDIVFTST